MNYISTRNKNIKVSASQAIAQGISKDGGLFVPESIPALSKDDFESLIGMDYPSRAAFVLKRFLTDFTDEEIEYYVQKYRPMDKAGAYGAQEWIGYIGMSNIVGSYFNVMGLPVQRLYSELKKII